MNGKDKMSFSGHILDTDDEQDVPQNHSSKRKQDEKSKFVSINLSQLVHGAS